MFSVDNIIDTEPFSLDKDQKDRMLVDTLNRLTQLHYHNCLEYKRILDAMRYKENSIQEINNIPFIPVRLFKEYDLYSVDKSEIIKTMTSSGTTGQQVSKIYLDRDTSTRQSKILAKIVSSFIGTKRLPMLIIDTKAILKDRNLFSVRGAGILGFSLFARDTVYALDENMQLDIEIVNSFLEKYSGEKIFIFGFTFMIWEYLLNELKRKNIKLSLENSIMIHGGGWKKLTQQAVDNNKFKEIIRELIGTNKVYNYYGMVEQTGSIYMECEEGHLHASIFSDIIVRDAKDFSTLDNGKEGLIQLVSILPSSYPGHSILTEDVGEIIGIDDCLCGRKGKYFKVNGRIKNAEIRGCSNTHAAGR